MWYVSCGTVSDKKLVGLKFAESANKLVWWKKVWPELWVCMDIRLIFATDE